MIERSALDNYKATRLLAWMSISIALLVLIGWVGDINVLRRVFAELPAMNPLTALCFMLSGGSLLLFTYEHRKSSLAAAFAVMLIGSIKFIQCLFGSENAIDDLVLQKFDLEEASSLRLNGIAALTAFNFILLSGSLLLRQNKSVSLVKFGDRVALIFGFIGLLSLTGFIFGVNVFYGFMAYLPMALHSAILFFLLSLAVLLSNGSGMLTKLRTSFAGAFIARILMPATVVVPILLGGIILYGKRKEIYTTEFAFALFALFIIVIFMLAIWLTIRIINKVATARTDAELKYVETSERFRDLYDNAPCGYHSLDENAVFIDVNQTELKWLGYTKKEIVGNKKFTDLLPPYEIERFREQFDEGKKSGAPRSYELDLVRKDGSIFPALLQVIFIMENGKMVKTRSTIFDNKERKEILDKLQFQAHILNSVPDAIVVTDLQFRITGWNRGAERVYGFTEKEAIGKTGSEIMQTTFIHNSREEAVKSIVEHGEWISEVVQFNKKGEAIPILASTSYVKDRNGKPLGFVSVNRDINLIKTTEEELRRSNAFLDTVLENIPNMIFVKDASDLRFIQFNKAGEILLGHKRELLLGKSDYDFFPAEQADFFVSKDREVIANNDVVDIPEELIQTTNGARWLHTKKIPIKDEHGKALYLVGISEDITDKKEQDDKIKQLNKDLEKNIEQLEQVNKELGSFTYSVSHDLRAPLRAVNGYAQMLIEDFGEKLDEEGKRILNTIMYNATKMGQLIDDLLAFSRMGKKELVRETINMNELAEGVIIDLNKNVKHKAVIRVNDLPTVQSDYSLMHQLLYNLVSNAIKYSSKKEQPVVEIGVQRNNEENIFYIKDNGAGFDMRYYDKLFGVFQRLHRMEEFEGTGVGLAIVQRIISKHGGRVWAEAKKDEGATFYFTIPS